MLNNLLKILFRADTEKNPLQLNHNPKNTTILAGSGRSGTTWFTEMINYKKDNRIIFEPFHNERNKYWANYSYRQYFSPDNDSEQVYDDVKNTISGKISNSWVNKGNTLAVSKKRILKDIRLSGIIGYIQKKFPEIKIVYILRHPAAVYASRISKGWDAEIESFIEQKTLIHDHLYSYMDFLNNKFTKKELHMVLWALDNYIPFRTLDINNPNLHFVFYEQFITEPKQNLKTLLSFLNVDFPTENLYKILMKPSLTTRKMTKHKKDNSFMLKSWKNEITHEELNRILEINKVFSLDKIYNKDLTPKVEELETTIKHIQSL